MLQIIFLGFSSGFPLLLTGSTIAARLTDAEVQLSTVGLFALVGVPYTIKFLWAPFIDKIHFPRVKTHLQHRKSWALLSQMLLVLFIGAMGLTNAVENTYLLAFFALLTALFSSIQDIVIDALRVEMLKPEDQGAGAAASVFGYRLGMLLSGAGALALASLLPWKTVYGVSACVMSIGIFTTLSLKKLYKERKLDLDSSDLTESSTNSETLEPASKSEINALKNQKMASKSARILQWLHETIVNPFLDFFARPGAIWILGFIAFYKLGDALAGAMSTTFYLKMGYEKVVIAGITKVFGLGATLLGAFIGGVLVKSRGLQHSLIICGILMLTSNLMFSWLALSEHTAENLTLVITLENISGGMGTAAFVAYMASLCNIQFTATQYALLTSLSSLGRTVFASSTGFVVESVGWSWFFALTAVAALPGMILLFMLPRLTRQS